MCWRDGITGQKNSGRFLENTDENIPTSMIKEPMGRNTLLNLVFASKKELAGDL